MARTQAHPDYGTGASLDRVLCCYLDDAGNTGRDLDDLAQPIHYNGALLFPEGQWSDIVNDLKSLERYARDCGFAEERLEFHGVHLFQSQKKGKGWARVPRENRMSIYKEAIQILQQRQIPLVLGCCDKQKLKSKYAKPDHPQAIAMTLCLERIAEYAKAHNTKAFVVADDCSPSVKQISRKVLSDYRRSGSSYGYRFDISPLVDTVHFMDSTESPHIQLCDLVLYAIRRFEATKDEAIRPIAEASLRLIQSRRTIP